MTDLIDIETALRFHGKIPLLSIKDTVVGQSLYIVVYTCDVSEAAIEAIKLNGITLHQKSPLGAFQIPQLPDGKHCICITRTETGKISFDGYWHLPDYRMQIQSPDGPVQLGWRIDDKELPLFGDISQWAEPLSRLRLDDRYWIDGAAVIRFDEFIARFFNG